MNMMKYSGIVEAHYGENVGMVNVVGQELQLCDHMEMVEGLYYATAFKIDVKDPKLLHDLGVPTENIITDTHILYLPVKLLEAAVPKYDDGGATFDMVDRMIATLKQVNKKAYATGL